MPHYRIKGNTILAQQPALMMSNETLYRVVAISLHMFLNFILISYLMSFDWTASWLRFAGFLAIVLVLFLLFVKHLLSFITFIKSKP